MSKRDIVLAELAELAECKDLSPLEPGWWLPRDVYKFRTASLAFQAGISGLEASCYLLKLYEVGLVDRWLGQMDIYYRINGDGLKALEETFARADEEMVLRVAKWAYNKAIKSAMREFSALKPDVIYWNEAEFENPDPRAEWIEGARKAIRGET